MTQDDERRDEAHGEAEDREDREDQDKQSQSDGEGAGPAEDLQKDPAYNPQGPERKYKGG
ncbi:MAG TPA: hypothetical protein VHF50_04975 [Solirubrobacterales bacterium]|nr:hypothetical protein [Solirubrobacterales bacterium]